METFFNEYGVWAIGFFLLGDDLGLPFFPPGIMIVAYSALAKTNPEFELWPIIIMIMTIPPLANYILFFAGRHGLRKYLDTHGHKFYLPEHRIKQAERIMEKYGEKTIFFAACWSTIRPFCSLVAGSLKMNPLRFAIYHFLGVCVWGSFMIASGYYFGSEVWAFVKENWKYSLIFLICIIPAYFYWTAYFKNPKK